MNGMFLCCRHGANQGWHNLETWCASCRHSPRSCNNTLETVCRQVLSDPPNLERSILCCLLTAYSQCSVIGTRRVKGCCILKARSRCIFLPSPSGRSVGSARRDGCTPAATRSAITALDLFPLGHHEDCLSVSARPKCALCNPHPDK